MLKILCACGNGMGSSMIIKIKVEQVLSELNVEGTVETASVGEAKGIGDNFDIVLCSTYLADDLGDLHAKVIGLANLLDEKAIKSALAQEINQ
ncbi:PTS sugar transporter subunit IIB [Spiroplasma sp. DGKH1]|uniref:PTS sugar transporter subunit IIB n=1 Tax=Spiroplasma sp. DGKH1 TaxID=3050074 RepID=UPI0034C62964